MCFVSQAFAQVSGSVLVSIVTEWLSSPWQEPLPSLTHKPPSQWTKTGTWPRKHSSSSEYCVFSSEVSCTHCVGIVWGLFIYSKAQMYKETGTVSALSPLRKFSLECGQNFKQIIFWVPLMGMKHPCFTCLLKKVFRDFFLLKEGICVLVVDCINKVTHF